MEEKKSKLSLLEIEGVKYPTLLHKKYLNRKQWTPAKINELRAIIPGTILEIHVKPGDSVTEGDCVLLLEAMKMRNRVCAPITGKVKEIHVMLGSKVAKSALLIEFE